MNKNIKTVWREISNDIENQIRHEKNSYTLDLMCQMCDQMCSIIYSHVSMRVRDQIVNQLRPEQ